jgi:hypothetical protein
VKKKKKKKKKKVKVQKCRDSEVNYANKMIHLCPVAIC